MAFPVHQLTRGLSPETALCKSCPGRRALGMESGPKQSGSCSLPGLLEIIIFSNITEKAKVCGHLHIGPWTWTSFQASVFLLHRLILKTFLWSPEVQGLLFQLPLVPSLQPPTLPSPLLTQLLSSNMCPGTRDWNWEELQPVMPAESE